MEQTAGVMRFSLLGGPLHELGRRWGLVRGDTNTTPLGLALGTGLWIFVAASALIQGDTDSVFSLSVIAAHVRLLLVIPLLFVGETFLDPRMASFVETLVRSGVVPETAVPALESEISRIARWKDSWLPDAVCLVGAALLAVFGSGPLGGSTSAFDPNRLAPWYWFVALPFFHFLALRWLWRLGLWSWFLWRLTKSDLHLVPTHSDGVGGVGYVEIVHLHFLPLVFALSALQAAALAEDIGTGRVPFDAVYPAFTAILAIDAIVFLGPLLLFTPKLWACRVKGLGDYMELASNYVSGFDRKWLGKDPAPREEPLLGTPDLQSLADLTSSLDVVRNMRIVPITPRVLRDFAIVALLPVLPLLLLEYPVSELIQRFSARLWGL